MQFIYDNLIAVMVSMSLAVVLLSQQTHVRQETLERQSVYDAKVKALGFAEWLEDDVVVLGARFGRSRDRFVDTTTTIGGVPLTTSFEYYYYEDGDAGGPGRARRVEVRYELLPDRDVFSGLDAGGDSLFVPLYRLERSRRNGNYFIDPADGTWVGGAAPAWGVPPGYGSPPGLSRFLVEPLDSDGQPVTDPLEADYLRLSFAVTPTLFPLHRARLVPSTGLFWGTTIEIRPF